MYMRIDPHSTGRRNVQTLYFGLGTIHRTEEDARTGKNPLTDAEAQEIAAANDAEQQKAFEERKALACSACGKTGTNKRSVRGANGQPDVVICITLACYSQWNQKKVYLNNR